MTWNELDKWVDGLFKKPRKTQIVGSCFAAYDNLPPFQELLSDNIQEVIDGWDEDTNE